MSFLFHGQMLRGAFFPSFLEERPGNCIERDRTEIQIIPRNTQSSLIIQYQIFIKNINHLYVDNTTRIFSYHFIRKKLLQSQICLCISLETLQKIKISKYFSPIQIYINFHFKMFICLWHKLYAFSTLYLWETYFSCLNLLHLSQCRTKTTFVQIRMEEKFVQILAFLWI